MYWYLKLEKGSDKAKAQKDYVCFSSVLKVRFTKNNAKIIEF